MTRYRVRTFVNDGPGRFFGYESGDILSEGPTLVLTAADERTALDAAWMVGNREGVDDDFQRWPADIRSLSVADVLVIGEVAWQVARFGFSTISGDDLARSLGPDALLNGRDDPADPAPWTRSLTPAQEA